MNAVAKKKEAAPKKAKTAKKSGGAVAGGRLYDVLQRPVITEKSTRASEFNKVTFKISPTATKKDVKAAVEAIFKVTVTKVNTINVEGKVKRFKGNPGQRQDSRKAIVTLAAGQSIDLQSAVK
jgi:large subunit ribosomal protein L23